jgi:hypothetical protein
MDESGWREQVAGAQAAVGRGEWQGALDRLDALDLVRGSPTWSTATELRAQAAYGLGDLEGAVSAWEDLHAGHLGDGGDRREAARAAAMVAMFLMMDTGLMAPVRGWLRRAQALCAGDEGSPARALVAMVRTYERFMCGDMAAARDAAEEAVELGTQLGVQPAIVIGRTAAARVRIFDGDLEEGLAQLDEVGALLMAGGADPLTTGMMYCELICAAQGLALHDRAREWTEVMERWRPGVAVGGINGRCRVHRAEMLRLSGPCDQAEAEALRACEELRPWMRREFHVLDLIAVEHGALPSPHRTGADLDDGLAPAAERVGGGLPLLDDRAKAAYRRRLAEVDDDIEEARRNHDLARAELAEADRAYLVAELARAVGLGNRPRTAGGTGERARTSVARAIRYAIARVAEHHRPLAAHLDQHVETGTYCRYVPDERAPIVWEL